MPRNDQTVRQLILLKKLESSRHGLTLEQLAEGLDLSATRHPRTVRRDLDAIGPENGDILNFIESGDPAPSLSSPSRRSDS